MGAIRCFLSSILRAIIISQLIIYFPNLPPAAKFSSTLKLPPTQSLEGPLSPNTKLDNVQLWHQGDLKGPEAFAHYKGELYTSLLGGDVVKLVGQHIIPIVKFGMPCKKSSEEAKCGRPLGLNFDTNGNLYVCDAYYGVFQVNVKSGLYEQLVDVNHEIEGKKPKLPNSIAITKSGEIYWTDSSTEFNLEDAVYDMLADGSGRLIHYNPKTGVNRVLIDDLHFANGVILSEDESFLLISETAASRIHRYYLKGAKRGTHDIFIEGLPGMPDNLNSDGKSGFLVPLIVAVDANHPEPSQILQPFPKIRKFIARSVGMFEFLFKIIQRYYPNDFTEHIIHSIGHFSTTKFMFPARVTILHLSKDGVILNSLQTYNKRINGISEAHIFQNTLYLGSPFNNYIGRISLEEVGLTELKQRYPRSEENTNSVRYENGNDKVTTKSTSNMKSENHKTNPTPTEETVSKQNKNEQPEVKTSTVNQPTTSQSKQSKTEVPEETNAPKKVHSTTESHTKPVKTSEKSNPSVKSTPVPKNDKTTEKNPGSTPSSSNSKATKMSPEPEVTTSHSAKSTKPSEESNPSIKSTPVSKNEKVTDSSNSKTSKKSPEPEVTTSHSSKSTKSSEESNPSIKSTPVIKNEKVTEKNPGSTQAPSNVKATKKPQSAGTTSPKPNPNTKAETVTKKADAPTVAKKATNPPKNTKKSK